MVMVDVLNLNLAESLPTKYLCTSLSIFYFINYIFT